MVMVSDKCNRILLTCFVVCLLAGFSSAAVAEKKADPASEVSAVTDVRWEDGECPICGEKVSLALVSPVGVNGGVDHDLFVRSLGPQPEFYLINTCVGCGFSGYLGDFDLVLPKALKQSMRKKLAKTFKSCAHGKAEFSQRDIEVLKKYELAWMSAKLLERSDEAMGWLALRASWVTRDLFSSLPEDAKLKAVFTQAGRDAGAAKAGENPADRELRQAMIIENKMKSLTRPGDAWPYQAAAGLLFRRHGENARAMTYIDSAIGDSNLPADIRSALVLMKQSVDDEIYWQRRAVKCFEKALLADEIKGQNKIFAEYLVGQLCLRLGDEKKSEKWFNSAMKNDQLPAELRAWIKMDSGKIKE